MKTMGWVFLLVLLVGCRAIDPASDLLPSWNEGTAKQAIVEFVSAVTDPNNADRIRRMEDTVTAREFDWERKFQE